MSSLQQIESAIKELDENRLAELRQWFAEFDAERWDRQFEVDAASGKLDKLANAALDDLKNGTATEL